MTRLGRRTRRGALDDGINSAMRYYINNYQDTDRQIGVDALLGYIDGSGVLGVLSLEKWKQLDKAEENNAEVDVYADNEEVDESTDGEEEIDLESEDKDEDQKDEDKDEDIQQQQVPVSMDEVFADLLEFSNHNSEEEKVLPSSSQQLMYSNGGENSNILINTTSMPKLDSILSDINESLKNIMKLIQ